MGIPNGSMIFQGISGTTRIATVRVNYDGYRETVSISSFAHNAGRTAKPHDVTTHRYYNKKAGVLWYGRREDEYRMQQDMAAASEKYHPDLKLSDIYPDPSREFKTPYEFYEFIGYDRKKQRFID